MFEFALTVPGRIYHLAADTENDRKVWMRAIEARLAPQARTVTKMNRLEAKPATISEGLEERLSSKFDSIRRSNRMSYHAGKEVLFSVSMSNR